MLRVSCPACQTQAARVVYYGLPHFLCQDEECSTLFGFWSNVTEHLPFNGMFYAYEEGHYFTALWHFLTD
jgi:hypothetical protein